MGGRLAGSALKGNSVYAPVSQGGCAGRCRWLRSGGSNGRRRMERRVRNLVGYFWWTRLLLRRWVRIAHRGKAGKEEKWRGRESDGDDRDSRGTSILFEVNENCQRVWIFSLLPFTNTIIYFSTTGPSSSEPTFQGVSPARRPRYFCPPLFDPSLTPLFDSSVSTSDASHATSTLYTVFDFAMPRTSFPRRLLDYFSSFRLFRHRPDPIYDLERNLSVSARGNLQARFEGDRKFRKARRIQQKQESLNLRGSTSWRRPSSRCSLVDLSMS